MRVIYICLMIHAYPGVESHQVRSHIPNISLTRTDVLFEFQSMKEHRDGGGRGGENKHKINVSNLSWGDTIHESIIDRRR
jgi:hypothetical protein